MRRFGKIGTHVWGSEMFERLSSPKPCARYLFVWLLCGPLRMSIPGLVVAGVLSIAEKLRWTPRATRLCLGELEKELLIFDELHRIIWAPSALYDNEPETPNVVRSWVSTLETIPECDLSRRIAGDLGRFLVSFSPKHHEAFEDAFALSFDPLSDKAALARTRRARSGAGAGAGAGAGLGPRPSKFVPPKPDLTPEQVAKWRSDMEAAEAALVARARERRAAKEVS